MKTGEIYLYDDSAAFRNGSTFYLRIFCWDRFEVMCEIREIEDKEFPLDSNQTNSYTLTSFFATGFEHFAKSTGSAPYAQERTLQLRPDLPMRLGRFKELSWSSTVLESEQAIAEYLTRHAHPSQKDRKLLVAGIYLTNPVSQESQQKPVFVTAGNGKSFELPELLYQANNLLASNAALNQFDQNGIGIYRVGTYNGLPHYQIGSYYDPANHLVNYEQMGVDISEA